MNPTDSNKPMFTFVPTALNKEKGKEKEKVEIELHTNFPPKDNQQEFNSSVHHNSMETERNILDKLSYLETLILQKQEATPHPETNEEIVNQLRSNSLQIAKLAKEIRQIEQQSLHYELKNDIENLLSQLRSTNLYLSKIDRKIDYILNGIEQLQETKQTDNNTDIISQYRSHGLLLSKIERKVNELLSK